MSGDLVTWLRAQLDAEARLAHECDDQDWIADGDTVYTRHGGDLVADGARWSHAEHLARWSPARVLAEVDAKRRMVDGLEYLIRVLDAAEVYPAPDADDLLRLLALPYADHPGYRPEWAP